MDRAEIKAEVDRVKLEIEQAVQQTASALEAWQASRDAATKPQLFTIYNNNVETERSLRALLQSLIDKLPAAGAAGPSEAGGAGAAAASAASGAGQTIACNLADGAPKLTPIESAFSGVQLYRVNEELFVDVDIVARLRVWLNSVETLWKFPRHVGPYPLFVNGLVKSGKTFVLTRVLLALLAASDVFGVGKPAEARVIKLDLAGLPVKQGFQAMLKFMVEDVVAQMRALGFTSQAFTRAVDALASSEAEHIVSYHMLCQLLVDPPVPVLLLIDEVQNLLMPRVPGSGVIDADTQYTAMLLLKTLVTSPSPKLLVAVTGSSMSWFMLQVGKIPPNGISVLTHSFMADLPPKHEPLVLQKVLDDGMQRLGTENRPLLSKEEAQQLLEASENAAFLMQALVDYQMRPKDQSMCAFLEAFIGDKMMREGMNEWGAVLRDFSDAERRAFLALALTSEGLNLSSLQSLGLQRALRNLTVPVQPGSALQVFATSYHRYALQVLIAPDGSMRELAAFLTGHVHVGWVDAFVHLLPAGNQVKAWRDAGEFDRAAELLQEAAEQLAKKEELGAAGTWHTQGWFQQVLFHEANQGGKGAGPKVESLEAVSPKGTAGRYRAALQSGSTLSAREHLAHYLLLLRNVLAHMATTGTEGHGGYESRREEGSGTGGEEGSGTEEPVMAGSSSQAAVEALELLRRRGRALSCAEILAASPAAQPFAQVTARYHRLLMSVPPPPAKGSPTGKAGGSGKASGSGEAGSVGASCLPGGAAQRAVFQQQQAGLSSGPVLLRGFRHILEPRWRDATVLASHLRPRPACSSGSFSRGRGRGGIVAQPRAALRQVQSGSAGSAGVQRGGGVGVRWC